MEVFTILSQRLLAVNQSYTITKKGNLATQWNKSTLSLPYKFLKKRSLVKPFLRTWFTSTFLPVFHYVCLSDCLPVYLSIYLSICLSVCLSVCLPLYLSVRPSVCLSACLSICLTICLPVCQKAFKAVIFCFYSISASSPPSMES